MDKRPDLMLVSALTVAIGLMFFGLIAVAIRTTAPLRDPSVQAPPTPLPIVTRPARTSYIDIFDEGEAKTVMILTIDIPGITTGKRVELPIKSIGEFDVVPFPGGLMEDLDGRDGGMNTFINIEPDFSQGAGDDINLHIDIQWMLHGREGAIDEYIRTPMSEERELVLPQAVHLKIGFRRALHPHPASAP